MSSVEVMQSVAQDCLGKIPLLILGSGASAAHGIPGMWPLGQHLAESALPADCGSAEDRGGWQSFLEKIQTEDLESALTNIRVTESVLKHIVLSTWSYLNESDLKVFHAVLADRGHLPLSRLFKHLLQSTAYEIQVVTPNYDRLAEYAAEAAGFSAYTGFNFGMFGERAVDVPRIHIGKRPVRTVNVWKVHGSFGWFSDQMGTVLSLPPVPAVPVGLTPVIITPGIEKYRRTHEEPFRSAMQGADDAVRRARGFLCIGYGFNDPHLQHLMVERCSQPNVPLVLITKEISSTAHDFMRSGRCAQYIALEECSSGVRLFCPEVPGGVELQGEPYWKLDRFLTLVTG